MLSCADFAINFSGDMGQGAGGAVEAKKKKMLELMNDSRMNLSSITA
jgi:hypothetical protein